MVTFIDTHAHLYGDPFQDDLAWVVARAQENHIAKVYLPNIDETTIEKVVDTAQRFPTVCFPMLGIHPCYIQSNFLPQLYAVEAWLQKGSFVGIGEIGIDLYHDCSLRQEQQEAFAIQVDWAKKYHLPLSIHCRNAFKEVTALLEKAQDGTLKGIIHCFTGDRMEAEQCIELGFFLGISGIVTLPKNTLAETVAAIDLKHLVLETDSPYLAPVPHRGKRNEPIHLLHTATKIAEIKHVSLEEVARITTKNAERVFNKNAASAGQH